MSTPLMSKLSSSAAPNSPGLGPGHSAAAAAELGIRELIPLDVEMPVTKGLSIRPGALRRRWHRGALRDRHADAAYSAGRRAACPTAARSPSWRRRSALASLT